MITVILPLFYIISPIKYFNYLSLFYYFISEYDINKCLLLYVCYFLIYL